MQNNFEQNPVLHSFYTEKKAKKKLYLGILLIIMGGIASGYFLSTVTMKFSSVSGIDGASSNVKKVIGSSDVKTFRDQAEGQLEAGGINGEGTHKLIRPGGESQTVYLTSSVLDLNEFVGKKVRVWGETIAAQKAGWFMDVGKVEIL